MPVFVTTCPHCSAKQMSFEYRGEYIEPSGNLRYAFASCAGCHKPITAEIAKRGTYIYSRVPLREYEGNVFQSSAHMTTDIWPAFQDVEISAAVPDKVARNFLEAAESRKSQRWNSACGIYRRCMEIALKEFAPDVEAWKLEKRIDKLADENRITPDIQQWAHELRLDGNEALHGDEDATEEMVDQMHHLTYYLLTYLYTLPNQIAEVRARRETEAAAEQ